MATAGAALSEMSKPAEDLAALLFGENDLADTFKRDVPPKAASRRPHKRRAPAWTDEGEEAPAGGDAGTGQGTDAEHVVDISRTSRLRKLRTSREEEAVSRAEYSKRLRAHFEKVHPTPAWATRRDGGTAGAGGPASDSSDGDDDFDIKDTAERRRHRRSSASGPIPSTAPLVEDARQLPAGALQLTRMRDANHAEPSAAVVQSIQFHHSGQMLLTAGFDKSLRLFQVDGKRNAKVQSVFLPDLPVHTARFLGGAAGGGGAEEVLLSGRRPFFYVYDLGRAKVRKVPRIMGRGERSLERFVSSPDGKWVVFLGNDGNLIVVSARTKQWVTNLKMNGGVRAAAFTPDGWRLLSVGDHGAVYTWDVRTWSCVGRQQDEGSFGASALGACGGYCAVGSTSGVVNVYDQRAIGSENETPSPLKQLMHLTTPVDILRFNHDSQILAMASRRKKESLKVVHLPSLTVFANWPTAGTPLRYVSALDFSPNGGFLACGNDRGRVLLYRLNHYKQA